MIELMNQFNVSPESFYQRLTNILPKDFQLKNLFFLRLSHKIGEESYQIKELHITHQQEPRANEMNEHYCRRWMNYRSSSRERGINMRYDNSNNEYLVFSSATQDPFKKGSLRSISVGILVNATMKKKFKFIDSIVKKRNSRCYLRNLCG
jgi:hypothetical protein